MGLVLLPLKIGQLEIPLGVNQNLGYAQIRVLVWVLRLHEIVYFFEIVPTVMLNEQSQVDDDEGWASAHSCRAVHKDLVALVVN